MSASSAIPEPPGDGEFSAARLRELAGDPQLPDTLRDLVEEALEGGEAAREILDRAVAAGTLHLLGRTRSRPRPALVPPDAALAVMPFLQILRADLERFAADVLVMQTAYDDPEWVGRRPGILVRYTVPGWTIARYQARDAALAGWYDAPADLRRAVGPLIEVVTDTSNRSVRV